MRMRVRKNPNTQAFRYYQEADETKTSLEACKAEFELQRRFAPQDATKRKGSKNLVKAEMDYSRAVTAFEAQLSKFRTGMEHLLQQVHEHSCEILDELQHFVLKCSETRAMMISGWVAVSATFQTGDQPSPIHTDPDCPPAIPHTASLDDAPEAADQTSMSDFVQCLGQLSDHKAVLASFHELLHGLAGCFDACAKRFEPKPSAISIAGVQADTSELATRTTACMEAFRQTFAQLAKYTASDCLNSVADLRAAIGNALLVGGRVRSAAQFHDDDIVRRTGMRTAEAEDGVALIASVFVDVLQEMMSIEALRVRRIPRILCCLSASVREQLHALHNEASEAFAEATSFSAANVTQRLVDWDGSLSSYTEQNLRLLAGELQEEPRGICWKQIQGPPVAGTSSKHKLFRMSQKFDLQDLSRKPTTRAPIQSGKLSFVENLWDSPDVVLSHSQAGVVYLRFLLRHVSLEAEVGALRSSGNFRVPAGMPSITVNLSTAIRTVLCSLSSTSSDRHVDVQSMGQLRLDCKAWLQQSEISSEAIRNQHVRLERETKHAINALQVSEAKLEKFSQTAVLGLQSSPVQSTKWAVQNAAKAAAEVEQLQRVVITKREELQAKMQEAKNLRAQIWNTAESNAEERSSQMARAMSKVASIRETRFAHFANLHEECTAVLGGIDQAEEMGPIGRMIRGADRGRRFFLVNGLDHLCSQFEQLKGETKMLQAGLQAEAEHALAQHKLWAKLLKEPPTMPPAPVQEPLLHNALEIWRQCQKEEMLACCSTARRLSELTEAVRKIKRHLKQVIFSWCEIRQSVARENDALQRPLQSARQVQLKCVKHVEELQQLRKADPAKLKKAEQQKIDADKAAAAAQDALQAFERLMAFRVDELSLSSMNLFLECLEGLMETLQGVSSHFASMKEMLHIHLENLRGATQILDAQGDLNSLILMHSQCLPVPPVEPKGELPNPGYPSSLAISSSSDLPVAGSPLGEGCLLGCSDV
jgi:hypothetical protein